MTVAEWSGPAWREEATAWLDAALSAAGSERIGAVEQPHLRPWSTVLRAETTDGTVFLKASGPEVRFEAGLYELLGARVPEHVLVPLAVDAERGWVLPPDGGLSLGEAQGRGRWSEDSPRPRAYGELHAASTRGEPLARGDADRRPAQCPRASRRRSRPRVGLRRDQESRGPRPRGDAPRRVCRGLRAAGRRPGRGEPHHNDCTRGTR